jgi:aminoglycoside/choline kinase family phosphotransferase
MEQQNVVLEHGLCRESILQEPLLREAPGGGFSDLAQVCALTAGGSDRIFCRIKEGNRSLVFLFDQNPEEFSAYIQIGQFLRENNLPVPRIYSYDYDSRRALLEDLGDETLFQKGAIGQGACIRQGFYQKTIDTLITLQGISFEQIAGCTPIHKRIFDYGQLRWETAYFTRYFLGEYCHIPIEEGELEEGFHQLAASFANEPLFLMHRDFQSQNIMWKSDHPHLIDFQGARRGVAAYDLASLLNDCYLILDDSLREILISYYLDQRQRRLGIQQERKEFRDSYLRAALQRNMQALGAFSFLSLVKKKKQFEQFIPLGVHYLKSNLPHYSPLRSLEKKIMIHTGNYQIFSK